MTDAGSKPVADLTPDDLKVVVSTGGQQSDALALSTQPTFTQFQEGLRLKPSAFDGRLHLNYLVDFQQFAASSDSHASFHRWTTMPSSSLTSRSACVSTILPASLPRYFAKSASE